MRNQLAQALFILFAKARKFDAVDVQYANDLTTYCDRQHNFRVTGRITGNMPVKLMNVFNPLHTVLRDRATTDTAPDRNADAGDLDDW